MTKCNCPDYGYSPCCCCERTSDIATSIDKRLRIIHNLLTEASTHPKATSDTLYRLIGARNALISLRERLLRESAKQQ